MPAWSPYSSRTTASWNPSWRRSVSSGSSRSESGTTIGLTMRCLTRVVGRSRDRQRDGVLDVHRADDRVLVRRAPGSGSDPVSRASSMTDQARSLVSRLMRAHPRGHDLAGGAGAELHRALHELGGVGVEGARRSAERAISEASSVEHRAERSSSCGSIPSRRTIALAEPLSSRIGPRITAVKPALEALGRPGDVHRLGDGEVLRHQLAEDHRDHGAEHQADRRPRSA